MSAPPQGAAEIKSLQRGLVTAGDAQVRRVVDMIELLPDRGAMDALIAPLRPRLARLRPPRKLRFPRLLFYPLDPLIVPAAQWRRGALLLPRTCILPLAAQVLAAMGADGAAIEAAIEGHTTDETCLIQRVGAPLWTSAAAILADARPAADWTEQTGLAPADHRDLARGVAALLAQAAAIEPLAQTCRDGRALQSAPSARQIEPIIGATATKFPEALPLLLALLLARLPCAGDLLRLSRQAGSASYGQALRVGIDRAVGMTLEQLDGSGFATLTDPGADLADLAGRIGEVAGLLGELGEDSPRPDRLAKIDAIRRRLDTSCRSRFTLTLDEVVTRPLRGADEKPLDPQVLEAELRALRRFDAAARRLGGSEVYEAQLRAAATLAGASDRPELTLVDRARLVELLAGPEAALSLLDAG